MVESQIIEALERGDFHNLPGKGQPVDLTEYFNTPEDSRLVQAMLKSAGLVTVEIELLREISSMKEELNSINLEIEKRKIRQLIIDKELQLNVLIESRNQKS